MSSYLLVVSLCFFAASSAADLEDSLTAVDQSPVCVNLVNFFNILNKAIPLSVSFSRGRTAVGIPYPAGKIHFDSTVRNLSDCSAYTSLKAGTLVHLDIEGGMRIEFPDFLTDNGTKRDVNVTITACHLKLHYHIADRDLNGFQSTQMNAVLTEVRSLRDVSISQLEKDGTTSYKDYTEEADDVVRPILYRVFDDFAKKYFQFVVEPEESDADGVFEAFKLVFKSTMLSVHKSMTSK